MTATQIRPASRLSPLVAGIRTAVDSHADWAGTAQLVADQLRRHLPTSDVLTRNEIRSSRCDADDTCPSRSSNGCGAACERPLGARSGLK